MDTTNNDTQLCDLRIEFKDYAKDFSNVTIPVLTGNLTYTMLKFSENLDPSKHITKHYCFNWEKIQSFRYTTRGE